MLISDVVDMQSHVTKDATNPEKENHITKHSKERIN